MKTPEQQKEGIRVFADVDRNDIYITYEGNEEEPNATLYLDEDLKESPISAAELVEKAREWCEVETTHVTYEGEYQMKNSEKPAAWLLAFLESEVGK